MRASFSVPAAITILCICVSANAQDDVTTCCEGDGQNCVQIADGEACPEAEDPPELIATDSTNSTEPLDERAAREVELPLSAFRGAPYAQLRTTRARYGMLLQNQSAPSIFVGQIEGEFAQHMSHPDDPSAWTIMTTCLVRVIHRIKGTEKVGDVVELLYEGGVVAAGHSRRPAHAPMCLPLDTQLIVTWNDQGVLRPSEGATKVISEDWQNSTLFQTVNGAAAELGLTQ